MQTLLSKADRALGRLDGSIQVLPNPDLFVLMYVRKEAVLSSQIEGTQASFNDLLEAEADIQRPERPNDVQEVLNYVKAMNYAIGRLDDLPVSVRLIREIHGKLMAGVRGSQLQPGELRRTQNWIGTPGATINTATFVPPPPSELLKVLGDFETFLHDQTPMPPLIKIGLAHAQFETIHPFLDGNGRVGRLLITFMLCVQDILSMPLLYLSHYFKQHRARYYDLLQATRDTGDWEGWLKFFLDGVAVVSNQATETARNIVTLREDFRRVIAENFGRTGANGAIVLETLFQRPILRVNDVRDLLGVSYPAANKLMSQLAKNGIIEEMTGQVRNRLFRFTPYIALFDGI
ncbi:MAG: Fic family protein [Rhodobacterales bacterium]|nr:Fic family protein [Rhodobacterales bacterium]